MILQSVVQQLKKYVTSASSLGLDLYFRVETRGTISVEALGTPPEFSDMYAPVAWFGLPPILKRFNVGAGDVFLDLGCGKGRALFIAARFPFGRVIGVELAESLAITARRNCASFLRRRRVSCAEIQIVHADAAEFEIPSDVTVVFMSNPFHDVPLDRVLENLRGSLYLNPRRLRIIYNSPVFHNRVLAALADLVAQTEVRSDYVIYELRCPERP